MKKFITLTIPFLLFSCSLIAGNMNRDEVLKLYHSKGIITGESNNMVRTLDFSGERKKITDDELKYIPLLTEVVAIHFSGCKKITDDGLKHLSGLDKLQYLNLDDTNITDKGLMYLINLKSLRDLDLFNTKVTDDGIQVLASIKTLKMLLLHGTMVTQKGVDELQKKLPKCYITLETREQIGFHN
jgi:hypothetical protein